MSEQEFALAKAMFLDGDGTLTESKFGFSTPKPAFPGLQKKLEEYRAQGILLFVVSVSKEATMRKRLAKAGINPELFLEIHSTWNINIERIKKFFAELKRTDFPLINPNSPLLWAAAMKAVIIRETMQRHNISPANALFVGDIRRVDAAAARMVGIQHAIAGKQYSRLPARQQHFVRAPRQKKVNRNQNGNGKQNANWSTTTAVRRFLKRNVR